MAIISSGIWDIDPTVTDGTQLAGYLNELVKAINTNQSSATRPPMIKKGGLWTKTLSGSDIAVMVYDGTTDYEIGKIIGGDIQLDSIWTEVGGVATYDGDVDIVNGNLKQTQTDDGNVQESIVIRNNAISDGTGSVIRFINSTDPISKLNGASVGTERIGTNHSLVLSTKNIERMRIDGEGAVLTTHDMKVNGVTVGNGGNIYSVAVGQNALASENSKARNVAIGYYSSKVSEGEDNTTIGFQSAYKLISGIKNTIIGSYALNVATAGNDNTAIGQSALIRQTTGNNNTAVGKSAGDNITTGSNNICIGNGAQASGSTVSNEVTIGNDSVTATRLKGQVTIGTFNSNPSGTPVVVNSFGTLMKGSTYYSTEEVDKKLAIKDRIIESLSDKLDKLEDILIAKGDLKEKIALNVKDLIAEGEAEFKVYKAKLDEEAKKLEEKVEKAEQEAREKVVAKKKKK